MQSVHVNSLQHLKGFINSFVCYEANPLHGETRVQPHAKAIICIHANPNDSNTSIYYRKRIKSTAKLAFIFQDCFLTHRYPLPHFRILRLCSWKLWHFNCATCRTGARREGAFIVSQYFTVMLLEKTFCPCVRSHLRSLSCCFNE